MREGALCSDAENVADGLSNKIDAGLNDIERNKDTDEGFEVDLPNHVDDCRSENRNGEEGIIKSIGAACYK